MKAASSSIWHAEELQVARSLCMDVQVWPKSANTGLVQAAKVAELLNKQLKEREKQYIKKTGATSLQPAWFTLREPNGLSGPRGSLPRFRSAPVTDTRHPCPAEMNLENSAVEMSLSRFHVY